MLTAKMESETKDTLTLKTNQPTSKSKPHPDL
jgi:hypothetical protein